LGCLYLKTSTGGSIDPGSGHDGETPVNRLRAIVDL
jgi:hypothetical protein